MLPKLRDWDERLKARGLNPGSTADLTVAALLAVKLEALGEGSTAARPSADGGVAIPPGPH
jgi:triphosphoribosyl-dephospho-CoA synthase